MAGGRAGDAQDGAGGADGAGERDAEERDAGRAAADAAARERLGEEARATATALLDWLGPRLEGALRDAGTAAAGAGGRPPQRAGPCTWCPVCAVAAAVRGEQPELTARLAEQASGLLGLLRMVVAAHSGTASAGHDHRGAPTPAAARADTAGSWPPPPADPPAGWPPEWSEPAWWAASGPPGPVGDAAARSGGDDAGADGPARPERPTGRRAPRPSPRPDARAGASGAEPTVQRIAVRRAPPPDADPC